MKLNYAFIFARGGSKGIKDKNIKLFNKKPLIYYSINLAKKIKEIKKVFVSSDSKKILKIAKKFGANTILRPKELSRDHSSEIDAWKHAVRHLKKKGEKFDNFISLPCTSPLRKEIDIKTALKKIKKKKDFILGISKSNKSPNFNIVNIIKNKISLLETNKISKNRQNSNKIFYITTVVYACNAELILNIKKTYWECDVKYIEIPKKRSIDIDDIFDFKLAELIFKKKLK
jgi:CMP-N-acetylneuraminic acid synthetase